MNWPGCVCSNAAVVRGYLILLLLMAILLALPGRSFAEVTYSYDDAGRITSAYYDTGECVAYTYDLNGNRVAVSSSTISSGTPVWGTAIWGCSIWTP